ncbi:conserved hypothetical protein [Sphingomonas sp. EC-HK361]|uniref:hypothetical protein n=1 Tax=Sphingomonas sp. EC-HK361 TaxID=2038397 RepID=UPI001257BB7B|nr:hypothetical protein [Sphingomonas sp. EC-HK361]VVT20933.1 conserved hypothetical protein [Sphingomonas sp. EC-HK361]
MICAAIASSLAPFDPAHTFRTINVPVAGIDVVLFLAMWGIAIFANRYWPIWLAATQLVAVGIHATRAYDPHIVAIAYGRLSGQIAYPMIALLLAGTVRHRLRLAKHGIEPDWTNHGIAFLAPGDSRSTPAG